MEIIEKVKYNERIYHMIYHIPEFYKCGSFLLSELELNGNSYIDIEYDEFGGNALWWAKDNTIYDIPREQVENTLKATYSSDGRIKKITVEKNNVEYLVYIRYINSEEREKNVMECAKKLSQRISEQILSVKEPLVRIFIDYFWDGQCLDIHAVTVNENQMSEVAAEYAAKYPDFADCSGNFQQYCVLNRDLCAYLNALLCYPDCNSDERNPLYHKVVETVINDIKENVMDKIEQAEDFKFITNEYD